MPKNTTPRLQFGWHIDIHIQGLRDDDLQKNTSKMVPDLKMMKKNRARPGGFGLGKVDNPKFRLPDPHLLLRFRNESAMIYPTGRPSAHLADVCQQRSKAQAGNARSRHELWEGFVFSQTLSTKENDVDLYRSTKQEENLAQLNSSCLNWKIQTNRHCVFVAERVWTRPRMRYQVLEQYLLSYTSYIGVSKIWCPKTPIGS